MNVQIEHEGAAVAVEGIIIEIRAIATAAETEEASLQEGGRGNPHPLASSHQVVVKVQHPNVQANELVNVELTQTEKTDGGMLITNAALRQEGKNSYVLVIEERLGPLGNTFIVRKAPVRLGGTNGQETLVLQGVYLKDRIVVESSEPLTEGQRVRV